MKDLIKKSNGASDASDALMNPVDITSRYEEVIICTGDDPRKYSLRDLGDMENIYTSKRGGKVTGRLSRIITYRPGIVRLMLTKEKKKVPLVPESDKGDENSGKDRAFSTIESVIRRESPESVEAHPVTFNPTVIRRESPESVEAHPVEIDDEKSWRDWNVGEYPGVPAEMGVDGARKDYLYLPEVAGIEHN